MDDKTEELRDIFLDVIERMRERFDFETDLDLETYAAVVRRYYDGEDDATIAQALGIDAGTVFAARADLHLLREGDAAGVDLAALRERVADGADPLSAAATLGHDEETARRAVAVLAAQDGSRRVSQRYRSEFEEILTDADMAVRLTASVHEDGLEDATEDMETDVQF